MATICIEQNQCHHVSTEKLQYFVALHEHAIASLATLAPFEKFIPELEKPKIVVGNHLPKLRVERSSNMYKSSNEAGNDACNKIKNIIFLPGQKK